MPLEVADHSLWPGVYGMLTLPGGRGPKSRRGGPAGEDVVGTVVAGRVGRVVGGEVVGGEVVGTEVVGAAVVDGATVGSGAADTESPTTTALDGAAQACPEPDRRTIAALAPVTSRTMAAQMPAVANRGAFRTLPYRPKVPSP
jgi:hypothetical protein